jgi:hypothetical protein
LRGLLLVRLGLREEVLVTKDGGHDQERESHGGAHIAPATTARPLRLKIGILYFGQRILPIGWKRQPLGSHFIYGNGSRGMAGGAQPQSLLERAGARRLDAGGTGSKPPGVKGWQRTRRHAASPQPRNGPCVAMATAAYSEHVGMNLHRLLLTACSAGEIQRR